MDFVTEMIMRVGAKMPEDLLLQELEKYIKIYQGSKEERSREKIAALCMMFISKIAETDAGGIDQIIKDTNETQALADLLKPKTKN